MKIHLRYLFIAFFWWISEISGQSVVGLTTMTDTTLAGHDIPVLIKIKKDFKPDSIRIFLAHYDSFKQKTKDINASELRLADFEISDFGKWSGNIHTITLKNFPEVKENEIRIKVWDEGRFIIIPLINDDEKIKTDKNSISELPLIFIRSSIDPNDSIKALAPIKDIIREEKRFSDHFAWYHYALLFLILILIGVFMFFKYRKKTKSDFQDIKVPEPAYTEALEKLSVLKNEKIWLKGQVKEFHGQLTYILREYLEKKFEFGALEQSTTEIISAVELKLSEKNHLNTISDILQIADLIKFAKASIDEDLNEKFLNKTIDLVSILR